MTDPLTFLAAALDAAQRDAEAATAGPWYVTPREYDEDFEASIGTYPEGANV
ncbi:MAG: hypothetical protein JWO75_488, partial [Actinomycetia bacterium]|nr:hypothetical protein [Actinomycetes bacterium]